MQIDEKHIGYIALPTELLYNQQIFTSSVVTNYEAENTYRKSQTGNKEDARLDGSIHESKHRCMLLQLFGKKHAQIVPSRQSIDHTRSVLKTAQQCVRDAL